VTGDRTLEQAAKVDPPQGTFQHHSRRPPLFSHGTFYDPRVHWPSPDAAVGDTSMGTLITASCTTGWVDWIHGELWLLPGGLLRVRSGLGATIGHANQPTVPDEPLRRQFSPSEIEQLQRQHKTNLWIPADAIVSASIFNGPLSGRLALKLTDGRRVKLLWLRADHSSEPLEQALASWGISV
jgi:hypothetical protein